MTEELGIILRGTAKLIYIWSPALIVMLGLGIYVSIAQKQVRKEQYKKLDLFKIIMTVTYVLISEREIKKKQYKKQFNNYREYRKVS